MVGSAPACPITLQNQPLRPQHCALKNTFEGPYIFPADPAAQISVNGNNVATPTLLKPGDEIQLGGVRLALHGTPERQLRKHLSGLLNDIAAKQKLIGELEFAEPAAKILQYYWELQRLRWIEHQRTQQTTRSSESSLMQQIQPGDLM